MRKPIVFSTVEDYWNSKYSGFLTLRLYTNAVQMKICIHNINLANVNGKEQKGKQTPTCSDSHIKLIIRPEPVMTLYLNLD